MGEAFIVRPGLKGRTTKQEASTLTVTRPVRSGLLAIASLSLSTGVGAQEEAQEEAEVTGRLSEVREIYQRELAALRIDALAKHVARLEAALRTVDKADESATAAAIEKLLGEGRRELAALGARVEVESPPEEPGPRPARLTPRMASIRGLKRSGNTLHGWTGPGTTAQWTVKGVPRGRYDIYLDYRPVPGGGGTLELQELQQLAAIEIPPATRDARGSRSVKAATFELRGTIGIRITPKTRSRDVLWLSAVRLVPAEPPAEPPK